MLKRLLAEEGIETKTPRETLKHAFAIDWIQDEAAWLQMLRDRNETSHIYDEEKAKKIYENIARYYPIMRTTFKELSKKFLEKRSGL